MHRDAENPNHIVMMEEWQSAENYKNYIGSYTEEQMNAMMEVLDGPIDQKILEPSLN